MERLPHDRANRTFMGTVIFIDIVEYSKMPVSMQVAAKSRFNGWLAEILEHVAETDRITLDTGDGDAICFLGDPEDALFAATELRDRLRTQTGEPRLRLRIGINIGPVKMVKDINGRPNIVGDGINCAQRIMAFALPDQIIVSRPYYEVVSCLTQEYAQLFHYLGIRKDKHVRAHELYEIGWAASAAPACAAEDPLTSGSAISTETADRLQSLLARYIGPIAVALVHQAKRTASDSELLYQSLADNIPDSTQQAEFVREARALMALEKSHEVRTPAATAETTTQSQPSLDVWQPAMLKMVEHRLAEFVGPVAKLLVARAAKKVGNMSDLYRELAANIDQDEDRKAFMATRDDAPRVQQH